LKEQRAKAERETGYWRRKEAEARDAYHREVDTPGQPEATPPPAATPAVEPVEDDFTDYTEFVKAHSAWAANVAVANAKANWDRAATEEADAEAAEKRAAETKKRLDRGFAKYNDFADVVFDPTATHITPMIVDMLADCDNPDDVAYHLAKDRVDGVRISRLTPTMAAREIAKIDLKFGDGSNPATPRTKQTTNAPPPITPVGSSQTAGGKDPEKMTQSEFEAHRLKQGAKPF
jgi:hypothetical protein